MYNMFRAIFCTDIAGISAKNRATASVMRFLSKMELLDQRLNPKREKPIWIAKFNFLGLLRVCESFVEFQQVKNLYEGGEIGEAIVKELRPLVAKGVHGRWATNLLLSNYRNSTLDLLIDALENESGKQTGCLLGEGVDPTKFKRYTTTIDIVHRLDNGRPIPVLLYGHHGNWKAGAIIVSRSNWYFREIVFKANGDVVDDPFGLTYHRVHSPNAEICLGNTRGEFDATIQGQGNLPLAFWGYGLMFADQMDPTLGFRYALVKSGWQYLNAEYQWSEHD
jgi:hypothetical protein